MCYEWLGFEFGKSDEFFNWFIKFFFFLLFNVELICILGLIRGFKWFLLICKEIKKK